MKNDEEICDEIKTLYSELLQSTSAVQLKGITDLTELFEALFDPLLKRDFDDIRIQREVFMLCRETCMGDDDLMRIFFLRWVVKSANTFALAYKDGYLEGRNHANQARVRKAANGRKLIGETTRSKVRISAQSYMHLPKEDAAYSIASDVQKSTATVRKLLSKMFPGDKWGAD